MLYNESEEPYLACSHMENMSSSKTYIWMITVWLLHTVNTIFSAGIWVDHLGFAWGDAGLAVQSYTEVHRGKTAQSLASVILLYGWVQGGWLPDLVLKNG